MKYGLIGEKLGHSFSKIIHNQLADYEYELMEVAKEDLDAFIRRADFKAINVTIPYKQAVIPYLYEIDGIAKKIGAVNTIVNKEGKLYGYNTDFLGLKALIEYKNIEIKNKKVLILGSGGTSKTAFAVAEELSAKEILCVSRSKGEGLISYDEAQNIHSDAEVIINTTPCGMYPNIGKSAIDIDSFNSLSAVVDAVYNPLSSELVTKALMRGVNASGGLYMLVAQAVFAAEKFTGSSFDISKINEIYKKLMAEKRSLILIGMPSSGKSTVGKGVSELMGKAFIDSDEEIVKLSGMDIPQIFKDYGEAYFRELESNVIANLALMQNTVIATGGGAVLNGRNIELLKENGYVVFLDRPLDMLITTDDRPLSSNAEQLKKRYDERYDIYCRCADCIISADGTVEENINAVKEAFLNENSCN